MRAPASLKGSCSGTWSHVSADLTQIPETQSLTLDGASEIFPNKVESHLHSIPTNAEIRTKTVCHTMTVGLRWVASVFSAEQSLCAFSERSSQEVREPQGPPPPPHPTPQTQPTSGSLCLRESLPRALSCPEAEQDTCPGIFPSCLWDRAQFCCLTITSPRAGSHTPRLHGDAS